MKDIVIVGTGGFGREVAWLIEDINKSKQQYSILGYVDDNKELIGKQINGYPVLGTIDWLKTQSVSVAIAIGDPNIREKIAIQLEESRNTFPNLIHPSVIKSNYINYGKGIIICAGSILTVNIDINDFVIVNIDSTIGHDVFLQKYVTILPSVNVSGNVSIDSNTMIGTNTAIIQGLFVGANTIIGANSTVISNIDENIVAVGSPAKQIKTRKF